MKSFLSNFITKNRKEFSSGAGVVSFFMIFLPLHYFEINFIFSFLLAFGVCYAIYYFILTKEAEDLSKAVENFEKK